MRKWSPNGSKPPSPDPVTLLEDVLRLGAEHDASSTQTHEAEKDSTSYGDSLLGSIAVPSHALGGHLFEPRDAGVVKPFRLPDGIKRPRLVPDEQGAVGRECGV